MNSLYDLAGNLIRRIYDSRISGPPVLEKATDFPGLQPVGAAWHQLREEALAIGNGAANVPRFHELMPQQQDISANDGRDWRMFVVKAYGVSIAENLAKCPTLATLLASMPEVLSASISFLAPGKHIPQHRGPFRGVIRYFLGLSVPLDSDGQPAAVLRIADTDYRIGSGEFLFWDDTYPHEVWNRSDQVRIALLLDIRRRGMPWDMELLTRLLIGIARTAIRAGGTRRFIG